MLLIHKYCFLWLKISFLSKCILSRSANNILFGWTGVSLGYIYDISSVLNGLVSSKMWEYAVIERWRRTYASLLSTDLAWCAGRCDGLLQLFFPNRTEKLLNHQDLIPILGWKTEDDKFSILSIDFIINILVVSLCLHGHLPPAFSQCHDKCVCVFQSNCPDCI